MRIAIRGFIAGVRVFEDLVDEDESQPFWRQGDALARLAEIHAELLGQTPHMIEIEFLDEPDSLQRFFRFGTDPKRMVQPIKLNTKPGEES
jgi:hypothetical protein